MCIRFSYFRSRSFEGKFVVKSARIKFRKNTKQIEHNSSKISSLCLELLHKVSVKLKLSKNINGSRKMLYVQWFFSQSILFIPLLECSWKLTKIVCRRNIVEEYIIYVGCLFFTKKLDIFLHFLFAQRFNSPPFRNRGTSSVSHDYPRLFLVESQISQTHLVHVFDFFGIFSLLILTTS